MIHTEKQFKSSQNKNRMKKIFIPALLALATTSGIMGYHSQINNIESLSDLALINIEALADGENVSPGFSWEYSDGKPMLFDCNAKIGEYIFGIYKECGFQVVMCQGGGSGCNERRCPEHG